MTDTATLLEFAVICRRAADMARSPCGRLTGPVGKHLYVELGEEGADALDTASAMLEAIAELEDGYARVRAVARVHVDADHPERAAAWAWVLVMLVNREPTGLFT